VALLNGSAPSPGRDLFAATRPQPATATRSGVAAVFAVNFSRVLARLEEWDHMDLDVLRPSGTGGVCMTCQHFRYEVGRYCVTLLTCPSRQGLIPQGEHLARRCAQWVALQEVGALGNEHLCY
jgi:hypothetical protein